ncbi:MAG TPA: NAD-dependent epimerase/dehydratase family protein [Pyrinomonadaceae bacterium]|nr:NAD-dependent epimerase/dehydratase family protein [Pyrinomonadaceae bacterium]
MPKTPKKRTAQIVPRQASTKKHASIVKKIPPTILVTGGTGFLGAHLVRQLVESGAKDIRVMATSIPEWLTALGVDTIEGSVTNADDVARAAEDIQQIYHLAGRVSRDRDDAREMYRLHVEGTRLLCDAAKKAGAKTIVLSSSSGTIAVTEKGDITPDETYPPPLDIIARWPYYASKAYQEMAALERFHGQGLRLVILNPSLLLGPGDERLSSAKVVLDFMARKIAAVPNGGLSFVDVRDTAQAFIAAMKKGRHGQRYLLGAVNWTFVKFFDRLERLTKVSSPRLALPTKFTVTGAQVIDSLFRQWNLTSPLQAEEIEMAEYFWYLNHAKARRELGFTPRDPGDTLNDTVRYVREKFLGGK